MSAPGYPAARPVVQMLAQLQAMCAHAYHRFWSDAVSLVQAGMLNPTHLLGDRQLTDAYLLALAVHHRGCLVTLEGECKLLPRDRRALGGEASKRLIIAASANEIMLKQIGRSAWLASWTRVILGGQRL